MTDTLVEEFDSGSLTGSPCVACRLPLPIQPAPLSQEGEYWHCKKCGTRHHGVLLEDAPPEIADNIVPGEKKKQMSPPQTEAAAEQPVTKDQVPARGRVVCNLETTISRVLDKSINDATSLCVEMAGSPFLELIKEHGVNPYDTVIEQQFAQQYDRACNQVEDLVVALEQQGDVDLNSSRRVTRESLSRLPRTLTCL